MNILVTGGSGLVGKAIEKISNQYPSYNYIFLNSKICDLTIYEDTLAYFKKHKPDYVIHLAAYVGGLYKNMNYKVDMLEKNLLINYNVLKCSHIINVKKCISCLSTCIFPDKTTYPINEKMLHNGPPHHSNDAYAYAKRILEIHSKSYIEQYKDNFVCIIPTNIYGPFDNYHLEDAHVIPALIHKCYNAKKENKPFIVRGSGTPLRQFIYSDDLSKMIMWVLESYVDKESIILSVNEEDEISIKDISTIIANKYNYTQHLVFDDTYSDGQYKKTADNTKFKRLYGKPFEFTKIKDGIESSIDWFIDNYNNCRK